MKTQTMNRDGLWETEYVISPRDKGRIKRGEDALQLPIFGFPDMRLLPSLSIDVLEDARSMLFDGILALQSLDDLGPRENDIQWKRMLELEKRLKIVDEELERLGKPRKH